MKRYIARFVVATVAFSVGIGVDAVSPSNRHDVYAPHPPQVESVTSKVTESFVPYSSVPSASEIVLDYNPKQFHPRGTFYIHGRKPKGLREFDAFELIVENAGEVAVGSAMLYEIPTRNSQYSVAGRVTKEKLTFVATPRFDDDFEYSFDGRFLRGGTLSDASKNSVVLKGKLSKSKGGVKMAEHEIRFRVEYLGC